MKKKRREERAPLVRVDEASAIVAQLEDTTAKVAAIHGAERAEHARAMTLLALQTRIVLARREWREETERRLDRALAAYREAVAAEYEAEQTMLDAAALASRSPSRCAFPRVRRCDSASPYATCEPSRCQESEGDDGW